jgi:hypothetical protein
VFTLAVHPIPQPLAKVAQKIDGDIEVPKILIGVLDNVTPVSRPYEEWSLKISYCSTML